MVLLAIPFSLVMRARSILHSWVTMLPIFFCCSVTQLCLTFCNLMGYSMPGSLVLHCLPEFAQTYVHWVGDAIQPSHPLLPPSPFAFSLSQYQDLFQWVSSSQQVAKVLELQPQSFQWIFRLISFGIDWFNLLAVQQTLKESSLAPQFENINSSALILLYGPTLTSIHDYWKNHSFDYIDLCWQGDVSAF